MKKLIAFFAAVIMLLSTFVSCTEDDASTVSVVEVYTHRTLAFFESMNEGTFYFKANVVKATGASYSYTQATDGLHTATIRDNSYEIYSNGSDGKTKYVHQLNLSAKSFDTIINRKGEDFLFKGYNYTQFAAPLLQQDEEFNGKMYYCEYFKTNVSADSNVTVYDKYYYDGNTLVAIVTPAVTVYFEEYSTEIPSHIYLDPPSDFKAGQLTEETEIDFSEFINN